MRCPHCATPNPERPTCAACGKAVDDGAPPVERLEDLITTEEQLGDVSIPTTEPERVPPARCPMCGSPNPPGRALCVACGARQ